MLRRGGGGAPPPPPPPGGGGPPRPVSHAPLSPSRPVKVAVPAIFIEAPVTGLG
ncbi:class F sortase, partial [Streptomyces sp. NPDC091040]